MSCELVRLWAERDNENLAMFSSRMEITRLVESREGQRLVGERDEDNPFLAWFEALCRTVHNEFGVKRLTRRKFKDTESAVNEAVAWWFEKLESWPEVFEGVRLTGRLRQNIKTSDAATYTCVCNALLKNEKPEEDAKMWMAVETFVRSHENLLRRLLVDECVNVHEFKLAIKQASPGMHEDDLDNWWGGRWSEFEAEVETLKTQKTLVEKINNELPSINVMKKMSAPVL
jgi:hypothetical protein